MLPSKEKDLLVRHWVHSYEEDSETEMIFRPIEFPFPPSRGRSSFELQPAGGLVEYGISPDDRRTQTRGKWLLRDGDILALFHGSDSIPFRTLTIIVLSKDRLVVAKS